MSTFNTSVWNEAKKNAVWLDNDLLLKANINPEIWQRKKRETTKKSCMAGVYVRVQIEYKLVSMILTFIFQIVARINLVWNQRFFFEI